MKKTLMLLWIALMMPAMGWADEADDEKELKAAEQEITAAPGDQQAKVDTLARQYNVEPAVVQQMRDKKQGWGEISIQLAMARQLAAKDPATYPTYQDALDKVQASRASGTGYGRMAKDFGFKLGPVVNDAKRSKAEFQSSVKTERPARPEKSEKKDDAERMNRPAKTERPTRIERPGRPEKPEHPAHPEKPSR